MIAWASAITSTLLESGLTCSWEGFVTDGPNRPVAADSGLALLTVADFGLSFEGALVGTGERLELVLIVLTGWVDAWLGADGAPLVKDTSLAANLGNLDSDTGNIAWVNDKSDKTKTNVGTEIRTHSAALITSKCFIHRWGGV